MLEAVLKIKEAVPDFHFILLGGGPDVELVEDFEKHHSWFHYVGPRFDQEKVPFLKAAKIFLLPGAVGLAILDSFCTVTPMVTTTYPFHGPEIEYLRSGENGVITDNNLQAFVTGVAEVLTNNEKYQKLASGCASSARKYSMEEMVNNFSEGIIRALS